VEKVYDPLRKKEVALTPEEGVRQWFIGVLNTRMGVPMHKMMSEVFMEYGPAVGGISSPKRKTYRADILVYTRSGKGGMIVECKRPEVELTEEVVRQALRYNMVLDVGFLTLTNGNRTLMFKREGDRFVPLSAAPSYEEICNGNDS